MLGNSVVDRAVNEDESSLPAIARQGVLSAITVFFLSLVWMPAAVTAVLLLTHLQSWTLPAELLSLVLLGCTAVYLFRGFSRREGTQIAAVLLVLMVAAATISVRLYDSSADGRAYDTDAILGLLHGINPIYAQFPAVEPLWSNHYPKATWYFAAVVIHTFHNFQLGKIYNFLLIFAALAYALKFFRQEGFSARTSTVLAAIAAFSPVAVAQMATYYVDGALGSLMVVVILSGINAVFRPSPLDRIIFALAASFAIGMKFTAGPYIVAVLILMVLARWWFRRRSSALQSAPGFRGDAASLVTLAVLGVLVLGYDPYITNMLQGEHPMYPVLGPHKVDIMTPTSPVEFVQGHYSLPKKFLISFFAKTQAHPDQPSSLKIPFTVHKQEIVSLGTPDARLAGWGVFFSGVMLVSVLLFFLAKGWRNPTIALAVLLVLATTFMNPECWWARYTPQFALLPLLFLIPSLRAKSGGVRLASRAMIALLLLNGVIGFGAAGAAARIKTKKMDDSLAYVAKTGGAGEYWAYREPKNLEHYDQFSGLKGIVICDQIAPPSYPLPSGGFPLSVNIGNDPQVVLYKGSCAAGPPL
jgi:hypothetical protein